MLILGGPHVRRGIGALLTLADTRTMPWMTVSLLLSLLQTALGTVPVIAMVPLLQLFAGSGDIPASVRLVADVIGTTEARVLIPVFALCIGLVFLICSGVSVLITWWQATRTSRLGVEASAELLRLYVSAPYERHRARATAEIYRNVALPPQIASTLGNLLNVVTSALTLLAICAVLLAVSPLVTLLTIVLFGTSMTLVQRVMRRAQREAGEAMAAAGLRGWMFMLPLVDGFREARLAAAGERFVSGYRASQLQHMKATRVIITLGSIPAATSQVVFALAIAGIAGVLFSTGSAGNAITVLGLFAAAAMRALPTVNLLFSNLGSVRSGEPNMQILADAHDDLCDPIEADGAPTASDGFHGDIVLRSLEFSYADASEPVFEDLNLVIQEHETTAIVGSSGAGKSTVIDILLGLLTPTAGSVLCGGRSILDDPAGWYRTIAVVPQDVFLLNDTLEANVAFGVPESEVDTLRVLESLRFAQLLPLVDSLEAGLKTMVGERGTRLSGGQRQRLGLARAMYREPKVLLLDEATSALDNETEAQITDALRRLHGEVTVIVVAHRLSTVRTADKLVFLHDGRIAGEGTFLEVQQQVPEFARLVELGRL